MRHEGDNNSDGSNTPYLRLRRSTEAVDNDSTIAGDGGLEAEEANEDPR